MISAQSINKLSTIKLTTEHMNKKRQDLGDIQTLNATNEKMKIGLNKIWFIIGQGLITINSTKL